MTFSSSPTPGSLAGRCLAAFEAAGQPLTRIGLLARVEHLVDADGASRMIHRLAKAGRLRIAGEGRPKPYAFVPEAEAVQTAQEPGDETWVEAPRSASKSAPPVSPVGDLIAGRKPAPKPARRSPDAAQRNPVPTPASADIVPTVGAPLAGTQDVAPPQEGRPQGAPLQQATAEPPREDPVLARLLRMHEDALMARDRYVLSMTDPVLDALNGMVDQAERVLQAYAKCAAQGGAL